MQILPSGPKHLDESELAERWKSSKKFIQKLRYKGNGPKFIKIGHLIRYELADVMEYEYINKSTNTCYGE
jgi:hypothetical protein